MKRGFTLMELLVVIAIIGILVAIAIAAYSTAQKKSRDAKRMTDMKLLQNAWEQFYADNESTYPADSACPYSVTPTPGVMSGTYIPGSLPADPKSGTPYTLMHDSWRACAVDSYCLCAGLESSTNSNVTVDCSGFNASTTNSKGLYCVRNVQ